MAILSSYIILNNQFTLMASFGTDSGVCDNVTFIFTVCRPILGCVDRISVKFVYIFTSKTLDLHFLIRIKVGPCQLLVVYAFDFANIVALSKFVQFVAS